MPLVIDAYNVTETVGVLPPDLAGIDVQGLIALLLASRWRNEQITLVCDGRPRPHNQPMPQSPVDSIQIRYSGAGRPADDVIDQIVRASSSPRRLIVVSSDRVVRRSAQRRQCKTMLSQEFLNQLANDASRGRSTTLPPPAKPPPGMSVEQVEQWVKAFNIDPEALETPTKEFHAGRAIAANVARDRHGTEPLQDPGDAANPSQSGPLPSEPIVRELPSEEPIPPSLIEEAEQLWNLSESDDKT